MQYDISGPLQYLHIGTDRNAPWRIARSGNFTEVAHTIANAAGAWLGGTFASRLGGKRVIIASMAGSAREAEAPSPTAVTHLGMPVRVPQASLAPQLRAGSEGDPSAPAREVSDVEQRAPEATRNMMMTMQQGWQRGRVDDLDDLDDAPGQGN